MKVVLFSGGTGSKAIQRGLKELYGDSLDLHIVVNAYDNGLSTGAVRKILNGRILGPSDLRKNQFYQSSLYGKFKGSEELLKGLETRFDAKGRNEALEICLEVAYLIEDLIDQEFIEDAIKKFFDNPVAGIIDYTDFSIANVFYAALAEKFEYSLEKAGEWFSDKILGIPKDRVLLISDESLFLMAETQLGNFIVDEGDLVQWSRSDDKITNIFLVGPDGERRVPAVNFKIHELVQDADIIIFSSGTQWSSLIPTYYHKGFNEMIQLSKAKKYLIMNNTEDKDMKGVTADEMLSIISNYLNLDQIKIVVNSSAIDPSLRTSNHPNAIIGDFLDFNQDDQRLFKKTHDPVKLVHFIFRDFYSDYLNPAKLIFDFDDTIHGRNNSFKEESKLNIEALIGESPFKEKIHIVSGNSLKHFSTMLTLHTKRPFHFFCEGGNTMCTYSNVKNGEKIINIEKFISTRFIWTRENFLLLVEIMKELNIPIFKLDNRNNVVFTIKPLQDSQRDDLVDKISNRLGEDFVVRKAGKTSIDIYKANYSKNIVFEEIGYPKGDEYYVVVGDEIEDGNDACFKEVKGVRPLKVNDPRDTKIYINTLLNEYKQRI